jgi:hypothetical protein
MFIIMRAEAGAKGVNAKGAGSSLAVWMPIRTTNLGNRPGETSTKETKHRGTQYRSTFIQRNIIGKFGSRVVSFRLSNEEMGDRVARPEGESVRASSRSSRDDWKHQKIS